MVTDLYKVMVRPRRFWEALDDDPVSQFRCYAYLLVMPVFPALAWYWGTSHFGWEVVDRTIMLSQQSALILSALFYLGMLTITSLVGFMMFWMANTYGAENTQLSRGVMVATYCATPVFLAGLFGVYPIFWLDILVGLAAGAHAAYLLYLAIPIVMKIPKERGFLFASSMLASSMVMIMGAMGLITFMWDYFVKPLFVE